MKKIIISLLILIAAFTFTSCKGTDNNTETTQNTVVKGEYHKISAKDAKKMMESDFVTVVDVRRSDEFAQGHVPNAILVTNETITKAPKELPDKDATLLIYCRSGRRSREAAMKLIDLGYQNVYDFGGIIDWPYEVVK